jgi:hypothetical protein
MPTADGLSRKLIAKRIPRFMTYIFSYANQSSAFFGNKKNIGACAIETNFGALLNSLMKLFPVYLMALNDSICLIEVLQIQTIGL